jgi:DNA-binding transcriptional MerR regulator
MVEQPILERETDMKYRNFSFEIEETIKRIARLQLAGLPTAEAESDLRILRSQHNPYPLIDRHRRDAISRRELAILRIALRMQKDDAR